MRYYLLPAEDGERRLVAREEDAAHDLTAAKPELDGFTALARAASTAGTDVDDLAGRHLDAAPPVSVEDLAEEARRPVVPDEVWAAGVTYEISEEAREAESVMPDMYAEVYRAERPEIFFKATADRTVGPGGSVGIREDSDWDVPEPELAIVTYRGEVVGYTIGNDMSSRSIEGENPLYLPQAKVYDRCCSIGPCVASPATVGDPHDLEMTMEIARDGEVVFAGGTSTGQMARTCEELVSYLTRHNTSPELGVLLTGTSIVPEEEFTLHAGDEVRIDVEGIGRLANDVVTV